MRWSLLHAGMSQVDTDLASPSGAPLHQRGRLGGQSGCSQSSRLSYQQWSYQNVWKDNPTLVVHLPLIRTVRGPNKKSEPSAEKSASSPLLGLPWWLITTSYVFSVARIRLCQRWTYTIQPNPLTSGPRTRRVSTVGIHVFYRLSKCGGWPWSPFSRTRRRPSFIQPLYQSTAEFVGSQQIMPFLFTMPATPMVTGRSLFSSS